MQSRERHLVRTLSSGHKLGVESRDANAQQPVTLIGYIAVRCLLQCNPAGPCYVRLERSGNSHYLAYCTIKSFITADHPAQTDSLARLDQSI
jgi:hypothetical protein